MTSLVAMQPEHRDVMKRFNCLVPRKQKAYGACDYEYSGMKMKAHPIPPLLQPLLSHINKETGSQYNFILVNWYISGLDYVSSHQDNEKGIDQKTPIATVSMGATRKFRVRDAKTKKILLNKMLEHGSLCIMSAPDFQTKYKHEIVKTKTKVGVRVSMTFRRMEVAETKQLLEPAVEAKVPAEDERIVVKRKATEKEMAMKRRLLASGMREDSFDFVHGERLDRRMQYLDYLEHVPRDVFRNPAYLFEYVPSNK